VSSNGFDNDGRQIFVLDSAIVILATVICSVAASCWLVLQAVLYGWEAWVRLLSMYGTALCVTVCVTRLAMRCLGLLFHHTALIGVG
jgi:hypothetical protein